LIGAAQFRCRTLLRSSGDLREKTISLEFATVEGRSERVELELACVPLTIFSMVREQGKILSLLPPDQHPEVQTVKGTEVIPAVGRNGSGALILRFQGGGELTIEMSKAAITKAAEGLAQLVVAMNRDRYH
jgi:hypothetical protein